jgi:multidrug resistance efflux pump
MTLSVRKIPQKGSWIAAALLLAGVPLLLVSRAGRDAVCKPRLFAVKQFSLEVFGSVFAREAESYASPIQAGPAKIAWLAEEGIGVKPGDPLATIDATEEQARLDEVRGKLDSARSDRDNLLAKSRIDRERHARRLAELERTVAGARRDVESYLTIEAGIRESQIRSRLQDAERLVEERTQQAEIVGEFFAKGFASAVEKERAKRELEAARAQLFQAKEESRLFVEFERSRETDKRRDAVLQAENLLAQERGDAETEAREAGAKLADLARQVDDLGREVGEIEARIAACTIKARVAGVVVYGSVYHKDQGLRPVRVGDAVSSYETVVSVTDLAEVDLVCHIPEEQMHDVAEGLEATLYLTAEPMLPLRGKVRVVGHVGGGVGGPGLQRLIPVRVELLMPPAWVRPGMTGKARILVHSFEDALVVPYSAVAFEGDRAFAYRRGLFRTSKRAITVKGLVDEGVVVSEGLSSRDTILREAPAR